MAMQINGNYAQSKTDYAERVREKQAALKAEKAKEAKETKEAAEEKGSGKLSEPQDVYIRSEKSGKEPVGLYRIGQDENGGRKIFLKIRIKQTVRMERKNRKQRKQMVKSLR